MEVKTEIDQLLSMITGASTLGVDQSFQCAKMCSICLRNPETENYGRRIIVNILNKWLDKEEGDFSFLPEVTHPIWADLVESAGFYPYLEKEKGKLLFNNLSGEIRKEVHLSRKLGYKYLHEEQKYLKDTLLSGKNLIVSAPTSFGKSLLIEEMIASGKYKNIVVIQPTLALLDETRRKMKKYSSEYKIIIRTSQEATTEKGNLFLLTSERVLEYPAFPKIDLLIIDEFYKLSTKRDDERADHLNNAFYTLLKKFNPQFYLLGPNIRNISKGFTDKYNAEFYQTNYSLIDAQVINIYDENKAKFDKPVKYKEFKEEKLFELLYELKNEQTIIYCSSPIRVRQLAERFSKYLKDKGIAGDSKIPLIEWIEKNVNPKWNIIRFLKYGIGVHDGALQKHINSSVIRYFNDQKLSYIFCTSTIIEGVNTSTKNVVIFDGTRGKPSNKLDFFDHSNIKGRAGRMMIHYVGRVYDFNQPPNQEEVNVDIPFFEQSHNPKEFPPEMEISIEDEDIKDKSRDQYKMLQEIPLTEKEIIKKNGSLVEGQQKILQILKEDVSSRADLITWTGIPNYQQLTYILSLAWGNLIKEGESTNLMNLGNLIRITNFYSIHKSIQWLIDDFERNYKENRDWINQNKANIEISINNLKSAEQKKEYKDNDPDYQKYKYTKVLFGLSDDELLQKSITESFQILRHWFQYKVPKWLSVINELQRYVCELTGIKPGNYSMYARQIENDFIQDNLAILSEYGIPKSAIERIGKEVNNDINEDEVIKKVREYLSKENNGLSIYEIETINDVL